MLCLCYGSSEELKETAYIKYGATKMANTASCRKSIARRAIIYLKSFSVNTKVHKYFGFHSNSVIPLVTLSIRGGKK
ncbi:unnamed protein product [Coffea canephora]|uniref:Uncharacterized protein n=1 Tax=Coffea canephora TaxID=49390 RepID=A0A068V0F3_COFCA|nr:unnamed protein product [Coffea canephora]